MASNTILPDRDDDAICPYDPAHVMPALRMQRHLIKCERNHPNSNLVTCPFNFLHRIPRTQRKHHIANCPDRQRVEDDIIYQQEKNHLHGNISVPAYDKWVYPSGDANDENWDDDGNWEMGRQVDPIPWNREEQNFHAEDWNQAARNQQQPRGEQQQHHGYQPQQQQRRYQAQQQYQVNGVLLKQQNGHNPLQGNRVLSGAVNGPPSHVQPGQQQHADDEEEVENWDEGWKPKKTEQRVENSSSSLRMPRQEPQVMQLARQRQQIQQQQAVPPGFTQSLSLAGIGRGGRAARPAHVASPAPGVLHTNGHQSSPRPGVLPNQTQARVPGGGVLNPGIGRGIATVFSGPVEPSTGQFQNSSPKRQCGRGSGRGQIFSQDHLGEPSASMVPEPGSVFSHNGHASAQPTFVVPRTVAQVKMDDQQEDSRSPSSSPCPSDHEGQAKKEMRKISKKLREIETLEAKRDGGQVLNEEQKEKLSRKQDLLNQLASLRILDTVD